MIFFWNSAKVVAQLDTGIGGKLQKNLLLPSQGELRFRLNVDRISIELSEIN